MNSQLTDEQRQKLWQRKTSRNVQQQVAAIIEDIRKRGEEAVWEYHIKFDGCHNKQVWVELDHISAAQHELSKDLQKSLHQAWQNITHFHQKQKDVLQDQEYDIDGVKIGCRYIPIQRAAVYVPGGTALYPSTVLMAGIPAQIAGVEDFMLITPADTDGNVHATVRYAAQLIGCKRILKIGGVQGICSAVFGIFAKPIELLVGPGNAFVTTAKVLLAASEPLKIDFPAGPTEIVIIADANANPKFIAADLLAQSEHGSDSMCVLLTTERSLAQQTIAMVNNFLSMPEHKSRLDIKQRCLKESSFVVVFDNHDDMFDFANNIAPEHLSIVTKNVRQDLAKIKHAGSIFLGKDSPVALGDYFSGSNHILPTAGYAKMYSGLGVESFLKKITYQEANRSALIRACDSVMQISQAEGFGTEHGHSVAIRVADTKNE